MAAERPRARRAVSVSRLASTRVLLVVVIAALTAASCASPSVDDAKSKSAARDSAAALHLERIPWEGGPSYWSAFEKAKTSGWTDPGFFPLAVFFGKPDPGHVTALKDAGINLFMGVEHHPQIYPLTNVTNAGIFAMVQQADWSLAEVGDNGRVVGWFVSDECEMGFGGCPPDQYQALAKQRSFVERVRAYHDGRFLHANFGNGILRTFWSVDTMPQQVQLVDSASADKYNYTSPSVANIVDGAHDAPDWPNGVPVARSYSYGWQVDQMKRFEDPKRLRPIWAVVETAKPYLNEPGSRSIAPDEIEGAVWSAITHEARGVVYFQHSNDRRCPGWGYSIVDCKDVHAKIAKINSEIVSLAPVLNTQSFYNNSYQNNGFTYYNYTFNNGTDAMLKVREGSAYIIAGIGMRQEPGTKTFKLPDGVHGTVVTVVGENRRIPVQNGSFTDDFAAEWSHHVYQVAV
jgi:hypothetical protein